MRQSEKLGAENKIALVGSFNECLDQTKQAIHDLLSDSKIKSIENLIAKQEAILAGEITLKKVIGNNGSN